jgi:hypothetical protein
MAGSCEASIELLDFIKSREFHTGEDLVTVTVKASVLLQVQFRKLSFI